MRTAFFLLLLTSLWTNVQATIQPGCSSDSLPSIQCPPDVTLSTGAFTCSAEHVYNVSAEDDLPGWTIEQTSGYPSGTGFPLGATLNTFVVTDVDGNSASCAFTVTVKDYAPPVAVCDLAVTVAIGVDDVQDCYGPAGFNGQPPAQDACHFGGVTWVNAAAFDDGSYDNCGDILRTIRRQAPYSNSILGLNTTNGHLPCNDPFPDFPSEFEKAISEQDSIKFYCGEAGTTQTVVLTVYQLDANGNIDLDPNGGPIYNQCFIDVKVQDKIKPLCIPPAQVTVPCENFDPSLAAYGLPQVFDNCCLEPSKAYQGQCGLSHTANYALFDTLCSRGTLTRLFVASDCSGNTSQCSQRVVVNYTQHYYVKFPDDTLVTVCNATNVYGRPVFFGEDCELMGVSYEDEIFGLPVPDACWKIERTWSVVNWCAYNPNLPLIIVPNPSLGPTYYHTPQNAPGPIVSACNAAPPWAPTISKITPSDTAQTNFCSFWDANANGYRYKQIVRVLDTVPASFLNCPPGAATFLDPTENHPFYWDNVFNPALPAQNLAEREVDLSIEAKDDCSGGNVGFRYLLFLDLDGDGIQESVINSMNPPPADTIYYGNYQSPNYIGGKATAFDNRPVPQNQKWRFAIESPLGTDSRTAAVRWKTAAAPNTYVVPELPAGTHKIRWTVTDGCGNDSTCEQVFTIKPSPLVCHPPADVAIPCEQFDPSLSAYGAPTFTGGCPIQEQHETANYAQFDSVCSKGTILRFFSALDDCANSSQCSQRIVVSHTQNYFIKLPDDVITTVCDGSWNFGEPTFFGEDCELLAVSYEDLSEPWVPDACFTFERTWTVINWCTFNPNLLPVYVPNPNPYPINGHAANLPGPTVSACGTPAPWAPTVVKINPTDPTPTNFCTFWNANANAYNYKQFIKIIDAVSPTISNCPALPTHFDDSTANDDALWNQVFNPGLPAQDLREVPVNLSVSVTDDCSGSNVNIEYLLFLDLDADGQQETVVNSVTLGIAGLGWNNVRYNNFNTPNFSGGTPTAFDNRAVPDDQKWGFAIQENILGLNKTAAVRWNTQQLPNNFVLPELPNGTHKIKWFATDGCGNNKECEQTFSIGDTTLVGTNTLDGKGFALFQNEPNPFNANTLIKFSLPEPATATISVYDAAGRRLFQQTADYPEGLNKIMLDGGLLASPGILYYKLEAGAQIAWRKMIKI